MRKTEKKQNLKKLAADNLAFLECRKKLLLKAISSYGLKPALENLPGIEFNVVDFFSGCGGMSHGFQEFSKHFGFFRHVAAFDIDKHANATFQHNFGHTPFNDDLSAISVDVIKRKIKLRSDKKRPLIVIGCAPCQGFSSHRKKDPRVDKRNTLVGRFAQIAVALNPELIIMENVPDLLTDKHWVHYAAFQEVLESSGYNITTEIINMANYGVPQERFRTVAIAARNFIPTMPGPVVSKPQYRTVRDAIYHLPRLAAGGADHADPMHITSHHRSSTIELLSKIPKNGGSRPYGVGPKCLDKVSGFYDVYGRLFWDRPAVTITSRCRTPSCGRFTHPEQNRGLSVREAGLLQGFPSDYYFEGPFDDKFKQVGNAVPAIFSIFLAVHVAAMLLGMYRDEGKSATHISAPVAKSYSGVIAAIKQRHK